MGKMIREQSLPGLLLTLLCLALVSWSAGSQEPQQEQASEKLASEEQASQEQANQELASEELVGGIQGSTETEENAQPAKPDTSTWLCELCPYNYGLSGNILIGAQYVSDDFFEFGNFRGLEDEGVFADADVDLQYRTEQADYIRIYGENLGIDSRTLTAKGGRQGVYGVWLEYDEIPYYRADDTQTVFTGAGTANQVLPPDWVRADNSDEFSALQSSLRDVNIRQQRQSAGLGFAFYLPEHWHYRADFKRTTKQGDRIQGAAFIFRASELAAPVDYETTQINIAIGYGRDRWELEAGYNLSIFDNRDQALRFENPFTGIFGASLGEMAREPDNEFHQFTLSGSWRQSRWLSLAGQVAFGFIDQDQQFLAATVNPNLINPDLPRTNLDGEVNTRAMRLRLTSNPFNRLTARAQFTYDKRDNDSPRDSYVQVITDTFVTDARINEPFSHERYNVDTSLDYRLFSFLKLSGSFKHQETKRVLQEVRNTDTQLYSFRIQATPFHRLSLSVDLNRENRDNDLDPALLGPQENPSLRRFHFAEKDRDSLRATLDYAILDNLYAGLYMEIADEDYQDTQIGLSDARDESYGLDLSATFGEHISAHAFYARESLKAVIRGADNITGAAWQAQTDDDFNTLGFGIDFIELPGKWVRAVLDFSYATADGDIRIDKQRSNSPAFPQLETERFTLEASLERELYNNLNLRFAYLVARLTEDDFFRDDVNPATVPTLLSLGEGTPDKTVHVISATLRYTFQ